MADALFSSQVQNVRSATQNIASCVQSSIDDLARSGQQMHLLGDRQIKDTGDRLASAWTQLSESPNVMSASAIWSSFLADSSRANIENATQWTGMMIRAFGTGTRPLLGMFSSPTQPADAQAL